MCQWHNSPLGIFPFNRNIFPDEAYAPSMVTDRPNPEVPSTSAAADLPVPSYKEPTHATGLEAGVDPGEPPATLPEPNPKHSSSDDTGSCAHLGYVSPEVIHPLPKATTRRPRMIRKKVKTRIVTDTPEKMELEKAHKEKEDEKAEKEKKKTKRSVDGKPIFTFKDNDEGVFPRGDVVKRLPTPKKLGGTARREEKFIFPCSINKWNVK